MASRQTRYGEETRRRAVRLYRQVIDGDERSDWQRLVRVSEKMGMSAETLRRWVREGRDRGWGAAGRAVGGGGG
jgi:transposase